MGLNGYDSARTAESSKTLNGVSGERGTFQKY